MARLALWFLGGFQVLLDGQPVTEFKSNKARALLAFLAIEADRPHRREMLAGLLWPDRTDRDALSNLRYTLASLRRTLGDRSAATPFLLITHNNVQFNQASDHWLDVAEVERSVARAIAGRQIRNHPLSGGDERRPAAGVDELQQAVALYRGGFLEGFSAGDAAPFEEWALFRREQIQQQVVAALGTLVAHLEARGRHGEAQAFARQQVELEPWNEEAHRALMRALALAGDRNAALHQFQACCRILRDELSVDPAEETVALYQAIRAGPLMNWVPAKEQSGTDRQSLRPPLVVAREAQLARLEDILAQTLAGAGRVVFVTGEAGSGKTALLAEFTRRAMQAHADLLVAGGTCDAAAGIGDPYLPFREILQLLTGDIEARRAGATLAPEHVRRLWTAMPDAVQALVEQGPDLIETLVPAAGLELRAEAFARQALGGARQARLSQLMRPVGEAGLRAGRPRAQADIFEQVTHVLQILARQHPLCLVLDDLQWADVGSASLLFHLGRRLEGNRIMLVAAFRSDALAARPDDGRHPLEVVVHELQRISGEEPIDLDACDGQEFVTSLLDARLYRVAADFGERLFRQTEGQPLFTVELLREMEQRGDLVQNAEGRWVEGADLRWDRLPTRVEATIAEGIDRLPDHCRTLLAAASVEGQEFTAEAVARALGMDERMTLQCLSGNLTQRHRLVAAVGLRRLGTGRLSRYRFRHHLFQKFFYDHLDAVSRADLHEAIGSALEEVYGEIPEELDALAPRLAWHFEAAGLVDRAARYHLQAGQRAAFLAAHEDAISHLTRGLALLESLPDSPARASLKLDLLVALEMPVGLAHSFWAPDRIRAIEQAYELAQDPALSNSPQRGTALAAVASFAMWSADLKRAQQIALQLRDLAESNGSAHQLLIAHFLLGSVWYLRGKLALAREHLDKALALYDRQSFHPQDTLFGFHAGIISLVWQSSVLWQLGYPDQGSRTLQEALAAAEQSNHAITLAFARALTAMILYVIGHDATAGWQQAEALRRLYQVSPAMEPWADSLTGRSTTAQGQYDEMGLRQMQQGLAGFELLGSQLGRAAQWLLLAQSCARAGQVNRGLEAVNEALAWMDRSGVTTMQAEALRLRGELLIGSRPRESETIAAAAESFRQAIAVARRQEARWYELRAAISLARLLREDGAATPKSRAEAQQTLANVYGWFSEGFATRDLQEAQELLEEPGEVPR